MAKSADSGMELNSGGGEISVLPVLKQRTCLEFGSAKQVHGFRVMPKSRDLRVRSFEFTVAIVRFCRSDLASDPILRRLAFQLVDAAGSVGANLEESGAGQTKADFIAKQSIALKEARESRFWLRLIGAAYPAASPHIEPHSLEASELIAMLTSSIKTAKSNSNRGEEG